MNVLERYKAVLWRNQAYDCWIKSGEDPELAEQMFCVRKPHHMGDVPWGLIVTLAIELFKFWMKNRPQVVMTLEEANFLGLESD